MIHVCYQAKKNCYATLWSYGEICVGCRCCDKNPKIRHRARLKYWRWWLKDDLNFDRWFHDDPKMVELQKKNIQSNIRYAKNRIRYYLKAIKGVRKN